jgi:hypothetical protein
MMYGKNFFCPIRRDKFFVVQMFRDLLVKSHKGGCRHGGKSRHWGYKYIRSVDFAL